jgi:hypothetical protein
MNTSEEIQTKNRQFREEEFLYRDLAGNLFRFGCCPRESKNRRTIDPYPENSQKGQLSGDLATSPPDRCHPAH